MTNENEFTKQTGFEIGRPYAHPVGGKIHWMTFHIYPIAIKGEILIKTVAMSPSFVHNFNGKSFTIPQMARGMVQYLN